MDRHDEHFGGELKPTAHRPHGQRLLDIAKQGGGLLGGDEVAIFRLLLTFRLFSIWEALPVRGGG